MARFLFPWVLVLGLTGLAGAIQSAQREGGAMGLTARATPHYWPCKNGNKLRNGVSLYSAPINITTALWEWEVPGHDERFGHIESTPLIDRNSNVYIETTVGGIFALARDGSQLWAHSAPGRIITGALDGDSLYTGTSEGIAISLDLATGKENWRTKYSPMAGGDAWTVTVEDGMAILVGADSEKTGAGGNDQIVALDTVDGSVKWRFNMDGVMYNFMPAVVDKQLIFIDMQGRLHCLSLADGTLQWKAQGSFSGFTTAGVAVGQNGIGYTNFNTQVSEGGVLKAYNVSTGKEIWSRQLGLESSAAPAVGPLGKDGRLGVVVGLGHNVGFWHPDLQDAKAKLRAFDAETGEDLWTFETPSQLLHGSAGLYSTPGEDSVPDTWSVPAISRDGMVYAGWEGGKQYVVDGATGKLLSSHFTGFATQGEPAIADNFVVVPSIGKVVAFGTA